MDFDSTGDSFYIGFESESGWLLGSQKSGYPDVLLAKFERINPTNVSWALRLKPVNGNDEMFIWSLHSNKTTNKILVSGYVDESDIEWAGGSTLVQNSSYDAWACVANGDTGAWVSY